MNGTIIHTSVRNPKQIVDVGCGTGIITCYLGERLPDALVSSIDISPVPAIHDKPDNVTFVQGDFRTLASTDGYFAQGSTDLVFNRLLICGMTDWNGYIETSVNTLRLEATWKSKNWHKAGILGEKKWVEIGNGGKPTALRYMRKGSIRTLLGRWSAGCVMLVWRPFR